MKIKLYILAAFVLATVIGTDRASAQAQPTTEGKAFWLSFATNYEADGPDEVYLEIKFVASQPSQVKITYTENGASETLNIPVGVTSYVLNSAQRFNSYNMSAGRTHKSIYIESDHNISVIAMNQRQNSSDASIVLPVEACGKSYRLIGYGETFKEEWSIIISMSHDTYIFIDEDPAIPLDLGEVYITQTGSSLGKLVRGNKPFVIFTHNICVTIPNEINACDCLFEQLIPIASWGTKFMATVTSRSLERVKIFPSKDATTVHFSPAPLSSLYPPNVVYGSTVIMNAGRGYEIEIARNTFITSDAAIAVASFMVGDFYTAAVFDGDPAMAWVPAIDQNVTKVTIAPFIAEATAIDHHYVTIVAQTAHTASVKYSINGGALQSPSGGAWANHASGYSVYNMPINADKTAAYTFTCPTGLTLTGYGYGERESYSYMAGASVRKLVSYFTVNGAHYQDVDYKGYCGAAFQFNAVIGDVLHPDAGHIRWMVDGVEELPARDQLGFNLASLAEGLHTIELILKDEFAATDTIRTHIESICPPQIYIHSSTQCGRELRVLTQYPNELSYRWFLNGNEIAGASQNVFGARIAGSYEVEITTKSGVTLRSSAGLNVNMPNPSAKASDIAADYSPSICSGTMLDVQLSSPTVSNPVFNIYSDSTLTHRIGGGSNFWIANLSADTTLYVTVSSSNVCENMPGYEKRLHIKVIHAPELVKWADTVICSLERLNYELRSDDVGARVNWSRAAVEGISNLAASGSGDIIEPLITARYEAATAKYTVDLTGSNGCHREYEIRVKVKPTPPPTSLSFSPVCSGTILMHMLQPPIPNTEISWYRPAVAGVDYEGSGSGGISDRLISTSSDPVLVQYYYTFNADGCEMESRMELYVNPSPEGPVVLEPVQPCIGGMFSIEVDESQSSMDYLIYGQGQTPLKTEAGNDGTLRIDIDTVRGYTVFEVEVRNQYGCVSYDPSVVCAYPVTVNITTERLPKYVKGRSYTFQLESDSYNAEYTLLDSLPEGLHLSPSGVISGTSPVGSASGSVAFRVEMRDGNGCTTYKEFTLEPSIFFPQIFSPNGDGVNDVFMRGYHVVIFDRLGVRIFEGRDGWNGEHKGQQVSQDTYFYILRYTDESNVERKVTGDITIIR